MRKRAASESIEAVLEREPNAVKRFFKMLGPDLVTGASDDDPSGIGTYAMAGASFGYATLWTAWVTFPLMASIQFICARIASGQGIAGVLRAHYSPKLLYAVVFGLMAANTINAGADMLAIAAGINLLVPVPITALVAPLSALTEVLAARSSARSSP